MKHIHILITVALFSLCNHLQAKDRVINQPPFCVRNTTSIEVSKVVINDTATVLHIYAKYRPKNWIRIAKESYLKDNNGKTYQLRSGIGITPDKEFWMPESGEAEFQLVFPPVAEDAAAIDFTEGEGVEGAFSIWGIQLKGKELPKLVLPKGAVIHKVNQETTLPELPLQYGEATVKGRILDYQPGMMKQLTLNPAEPIKGYDNEITVDLQPDGSFNTAFHVTGVTIVSSYIYGSTINFFVEPGQTTEITINLREISRQKSKFHKDSKPYGLKAYINGPLETIAQEGNQSQMKTVLIADYNVLIKEAEEMDANALKVYLLDRSAQIQQEIDKQPVSHATRQLLTLENGLDLMGALYNVPSILTQAYLQKNKLPNEDGQEYYMKLSREMPSDYIPASCYETLNLPYAGLSSSYVNMIRRTLHLKDSLSHILGTDKGFYFDIVNAATIYQKISDFSPLDDEQQLAQLPVAYRKMLEQANDKLLALLESNKKKTGFRVNETGEISDEDLFASIISKFRGKVLLVDFWATWCGPCRIANKAMIPMKEELKDKEIVYLYITGETSPLKTWENMIPDIHGEHYRLSKPQWNYLNNSFKIEGVPTYLVIDREGNIKLKQTGFPGAGKIKEELLKVTNQ